MPQSSAHVLLRIVFSTKHRYPLLADENMRGEMHACLGGTCNQLGCPVVTVGGVADHVHILCLLSRRVVIAGFVGDLKRSSSKWVKSKGGKLSKFSWQNGYAVFSVDRSEVERDKGYIAGQREHHRKKLFQDEARALLKAYAITYDERFVWD